MDDRTTSIDDRVNRSAAGDNPDERTREIRAEIEHTRGELSETIEAIQEKLRPGHIVAEASAATRTKVKNMAYNAAETAEDWWEGSRGARLVDHIRRNPLPATLAGVGLAWLAFSDGSSRRYRRYGRPADWAQAPGVRSYEASQAGEESLTSRVSESARETVEEARRMARRSQTTLERMLNENPLAVGAAAVVLGAAIGLAIPETERENEWMGEARDNTVERVQQMAQGAVDRVKDAVADAAVRGATGD